MRVYFIIFLVILSSQRLYSQGKFFSGIGGGGASAYQTFSTLPVELLNIEAYAEGRKVVLQWQTATEKDNDYFLIETHSAQGKFEIRDSIRGNGTVKEISEYEWIDLKPLRGLNYYRITQFDFDGKSEILGILDVAFMKTSTLDVFPNPATHRINISGTATENSVLTILDGKGKRVKLLSVNVELDVSSWARGVYYLKYTDKDISLIERIKLID